MKKIVLLVAIVVASVGIANAQSPQRPNYQPEKRIEKQVKILDEKLNLSDEQEKQVKAVYEEFFKKQKSSFKKGQSKQEEMNKKIDSLLTEEQKAIFKKFREEQKQHKTGSLRKE